jgi:YebC/PmpR family DNA-binding regulatory protein
MSGHSHWAGIKHRKGLNDAKRAKIFTKHGKMITIAARDGGGNPNMNFSLRLAIERARMDNMPKENIERSIKRGTGELKGEEIVEIIYEAMGPGNIMMIIKTATDNRNRTVSELKSLLLKSGGKMGEMGSAMWNFEKVGNIYAEFGDKDFEEVELMAIDAGAKDVKTEEKTINVFTEPQELQKVQAELEKAGLKILEAGLIFLPKSTVKVDENTRIDYEKLLEVLDDQDDVEEIYDNVG